MAYMKTVEKHNGFGLVRTSYCLIKNLGMIKGIISRGNGQNAAQIEQLGEHVNVLMWTMSRRVIGEIKSFFSTGPRHEFEKLAGEGGTGVALCFRDKEAGPDGFPRYIVKPAVMGEDDEIKNEIKWLEVR